MGVVVPEELSLGFMESRIHACVFSPEAVDVELAGF